MFTIFLNPLNEGLFATIIFSITKQALLDTTFVFIGTTIILIAVTYIFLITNKSIFFYKKRIRKHLDVWISKAILEELDDDEANNHLPAKFQRILKNKIAQEFVMQELLQTKKSLTGAAAANIVKIYLQLQLKEVSVKKIDSKKWHTKAKGIQELYLMDQQDMLVKIYRYTNSKNDFIRMEAQAAIVHLSGFDGLRFLDLISFPLTNWQQIKLLDRLSQFKFTGLQKLNNWLQSPNDSVIVFALKLVEQYQQFEAHDAVANCLLHKNNVVKMQAIQAIVSIANDTTAQILIKHYHTYETPVQLTVLTHLATIATDKEIDFLTHQMQEENNLIKLKAANALIKADKLGADYLQRMIKEENDIYHKIFLHVKANITT